MFETWRVPAQPPQKSSPGQAKPPSVLGLTTLPRIQPRLNGSVSARLPQSYSKPPTPFSSRTPRHLVSAPQVSSSMDVRAGLTENCFTKSPHVDRAVMNEIMRLQQRKNLSEQALRRSILPDGRLSVEKWLQTANENERHIALKFFTSLSKNPQLRTCNDVPGSHLQQVINTLKTSKSVPAMPSYDQERDDASPSRLQFIKLLHPSERAKRWQYTTWHHQPVYKQLDKVDNWSSHYTRPHAPPHRHFVIHPDWG